MAGKIIIDTERCKGCGLCVQACPKNCITISKQSNKNGYFPAVSDNADCTGCAMCAIICPDAAIEVSRDNDVAAFKPAKKSKADLLSLKGGPTG